MPTTRTPPAARQTAGGRAGAASPRKKRVYKPPVKSGEWYGRFLKKFAETGTITAACEAAAVSRKTVYNARQRDEDFALAFADADEAVTESLKQEAKRRALDGSDRLLEFLLKARRPEKYSDQHRMIHSGEVASRQVLTLEQQREELEAFGMQAATAVAAGPEAVLPPEDL